MKELFELTKAEPGKQCTPDELSASSAAERMFKLGLKVDMIRVPFQGAAPLITSTIAGHTPIAFIGSPCQRLL